MSIHKKINFAKKKKIEGESYRKIFWESKTASVINLNCLHSKN